MNSRIAKNRDQLHETIKIGHYRYENKKHYLYLSIECFFVCVLNIQR